MSEARVLWLVRQYPHPRALARRARDGSLFVVLRRLEACGLLRRRRGLYRLTQRGEHELKLMQALFARYDRHVDPAAR
jgi:DNA-binding PadR family transcriptional regulator